MKLFKNFFRKLFNKIYVFGKKEVIAICIIAMVFSVLQSTYDHILDSHISYMILTLNYKNARKGMTPNGSRFSISEIKSDDVLQRAIDIMGDKNLYVDDVKSRIGIDSKIPQSSVDTVTSEITAGSNYSYCPSEFDIYYSQKNKLGKNNTENFLKALSEAYREFFIDKYSDKNTILEFKYDEEISRYEYLEIYQILCDKVNSMISYLGNHNEDSKFRSQTTGYTFENLVTMLINLRDIDLNKYESYVLQNKISKDRISFVRKHQYAVENQSMRYDMSRQSSDIMNEALKKYDAHITGVAFIPSVDKNNQFYMSRTKTGIDNMVNKSYKDGVTATELKKDIDANINIIDKYASAADTPEDIKESADEMISEICRYLSKISTLAIQTDRDYISSKTNNYLTFKFDSNSGISFVLIIKRFLLYFVLFTAFAVLISIIYLWYNKKKELLKKKVDLISKEG